MDSKQNINKTYFQIFELIALISLPDDERDSLELEEATGAEKGNNIDRIIHRIVRYSKTIFTCRKENVKYYFKTLNNL
jgi:hypothetical protein